MTIKVLVVDDEPNLQPLVQQIFRRQVKNKEYQLSFALNGLEALQQIQADPEIDIVLTDINMPNMDGLTLLVEIAAIKPTLNPVLTPLVRSAYDDMENIRRAMNSGAFDFLTKPIDPQDLRITMQKTVQHVEQLRRARAQEQAAKEALLHLNEELERRVQERTAALQSANEALMATNAELDAFAHTVAHDLKNPLGIIISYSDLLMQSGLDFEPEELLDIFKEVQKSSYKAVEIIEALLILAGVRKQDVEFRPLNMADIVDHACRRLHLLIRDHQAEVICPPEWPAALGYRPWIEEVWVNYLSNGLKYGGPPPRLEVGATPQPNGMIRFWVKDNGAGLPPEAQQQLFSEFARLETLRFEGHGLGLSIVRRIVEKIGGEVVWKVKWGRVLPFISPCAPLRNRSNRIFGG
jgi:signal transduction histidine kinase